MPSPRGIEPGLLATRDSRLATPSDHHLHFEGCLFPATLIRIAGEEAARTLRHQPGTGLSGFLACLRDQLRLLASDAAFEAALDGFALYLKQQRLARAEVFFSPLIYDKVGYSSESALARLAARVPQLPAGTVFVFDTVRQFGPGAAERVVELAAQWRDRLPIAAVGMGGDEDALPAREFRGAFDEARKLGFGLTCHAGEAGPARSVWEALDELGATRIGHGLAAAGDPALLVRMKKDGIAIECCPASNLALGLVEKFAVHPVHQFIAAGIPVLPGSDDPAVFGVESKLEWARIAAVAGAEKLEAWSAAHAWRAA